VARAREEVLPERLRHAPEIGRLRT
jgi:hypothetical protein